VFFTITAIVLLAALVVILSTVLTPPHVDTGTFVAQSVENTRERFETHYLPLVLRMHAGVTLRALSDDAANRGTYLSMPSDFTSAMLSATYSAGGLPLENLTTVYERLANASREAGIANVTITVTNVTIAQTGAFTARAVASVHYTLASKDGSTRYDRAVTVAADVSLAGVTDTLYSIESDGTAFAQRRTVTPFLREGWNTSEVERLADEGAYVTDPDAPSLFDRFEGDAGAASPYGVVSLLPRAYTPPDNRTSVDSEYFLPTNEECRYASGNLRLTYARAVEWNVTGTTLVGSVSCPPAP
jgi:hypothetical protein